MDYIKVSLDTTDEQLDSLTQQLEGLGATGFVIESEEDFKNFLENNTRYWDYVDSELEEKFKGLCRVSFYLGDDDEGRKILSSVIEQFPVAVTEHVRDEDWENNWKQYYMPIPVGERLLIVPQWIEASEEGRVNLRLDPGLTFGTGSHATTRMCLEACQTVETSHLKILDLGCGSGILGIGALILGADSCVFCDIDPKSADTVRDNSALNDISPEQFKVFIGDVIGDKGLRKTFGTGYDVVFANIVSDVIIPLSAFVPEFMKPDGLFICSGIIEGRQDEVKGVLESNGFNVIEHFCEEEWHCYLCKLK